MATLVFQHLDFPRICKQPNSPSLGLDFRRKYCGTLHLHQPHLLWRRGHIQIAPRSVHLHELLESRDSQDVELSQLVATRRVVILCRTVLVMLGNEWTSVTSGAMHEEDVSTLVSMNAVGEPDAGDSRITLLLQALVEMHLHRHAGQLNMTRVLRAVRLARVPLLLNRDALDNFFGDEQSVLRAKLTGPVLGWVIQTGFWSEKALQNSLFPDSVYEAGCTISSPALGVLVKLVDSWVETGTLTLGLKMVISIDDVGPSSGTDSVDYESAGALKVDRIAEAFDTGRGLFYGSWAIESDVGIGSKRYIGGLFWEGSFVLVAREAPADSAPLLDAGVDPGVVQLLHSYTDATNVFVDFENNGRLQKVVIAKPDF
eukprot:IDg11911t1